MQAGYWHVNYWLANYWAENYWPEYGYQAPPEGVIASYEEEDLMIGKHLYISTATTTVVKNKPGKLLRIVVTETAAGAISIYDNASVASGEIAVLKASVAEGSYIFDVACRNGIVIVTAAASKLTVVFK